LACVSSRCTLPALPLCTSSSPGSGPHRHLHSFPTRRSSDLHHGTIRQRYRTTDFALGRDRLNWPRRRARGHCIISGEPPRFRPRSEEHTSELQSRENLVCRLLLEKKNEEKASAVVLLIEQST